MQKLIKIMLKRFFASHDQGLTDEELKQSQEKRINKTEHEA